MSEQAAFAFWKGRAGDTAAATPEPRPKPTPKPRHVAVPSPCGPPSSSSPPVRPLKPPKPANKPSLSPSPPPPPSPSSSPSSSSIRRAPPPPPPPQKIPARSSSEKRANATPHKVPLLPPGSSWKPTKPTATATGRNESLRSTNWSGPKTVARTTQEQRTTDPRRHDDKPTNTAEVSGSGKQVFKIIQKLSFDDSQTQFGQISRGSDIHPTPHSVPPTSKENKFVLPPRASLRGANIGANEGGPGKEGANEGAGKVSVQAASAVREELKRRKYSGSRVKTEAITTGEGAREEGERGREEGGRRSVRESRSFSGSRKSAKIKSSWTCYLDGPADNRGPTSPTPLSPPPSPLSSPVKLSHPPLSPTSSASLIQSFTESFRTSVTKSSVNYLRDNAPVSMETIQFWEMVDSVSKEGGDRHGYLCSPLLSSSHGPSSSSPPLPRTTTISHTSTASSYRGNGGGDHVISVVMVTTPGESPVSFQCSAQLTVNEVIKKGVAQLRKGQRSTETRWLKVCGRDEYLDPEKKLTDYVCIHNCLKLDAEVRVQIINQSELPTSLACEPQSFPIPPATPTSAASSFHTISGQELNTLLDSYLSKATKFRSVVLSQREEPSPVPIPALVQTVISCIRLLCERLLYVEPPSLSDAVNLLRFACKHSSYHDNNDDVISTTTTSSIGGVTDNSEEKKEDEDLKKKALSPAHKSDDVINDDVIANEGGGGRIVKALELVREGVCHLVTMYCLSLLPGYLPTWWAEPQDSVTMVLGHLQTHWGRAYFVRCSEVVPSSSEDEVWLSEQTRTFRVEVCALHKLPIIEFRRYSYFQLEACIYHGGLSVSKRTCSPPAKISHSFFSSIVWRKWLNFGVSLSQLPREARLCLTLHGLETVAGGNDLNRTPVAWVIQKLFDSRGDLIFGPRLLGMWGGDETADPLDSPYPNTSRDAVLLELMFEDSGERVKCDDAPPTTTSHAPSSSAHKKGGAPPSLSYRGLKKMADRDRFSSLSMEDEKLIWSNRFLLRNHLSSSPRGLPLLILSTPHWTPPHRDDVWAVLGAWPCHDPVHGLELLDPQFADGEVRKTAVSWLSGLHDDDLCDFLPQLVQSLRHDTSEGSAMAWLLLRRASLSPRIAHHLYWQLRILATATGERYDSRYRNMFQALELLVGERRRTEFATQEELIEQLVAMAAVVKATRDAHRQTVLVHELQRVGERIVGHFRLPLSPSLLVRGLDIESSSFFNSNTVPLKISFLNSDPNGDNIDIIFKVGDDLRQDILVLQMIKLMEKIWLRAGLDLKMVTYDCVATGQDHGMLEVVGDSATLRTIQTERGVTGSFKDKPLSNWLMRYNTSESDYRKAVDNFTFSCAGYCVATYVLGICDRHNDNIMVKRSGQMFHIDFGKILGNAQMFGSIKRDRVPFVLTRDMAYVINDGDRPTSRFQQFVDLCCTAYNELRRHTHTLLSLLSLMLPSGLAELSSADDVLYVRDALLPGRSDAEATFAFTKHIEDSLGSMATQINFFIHNLAQLKFSSPQAPPTLLTFVPQAYSIETDGRISSAVVVAYYMKYYPDSHTVYQIQVTRPQVGTTMLFRRYREFDELHRRLSLCFPGDELPSFTGKTYLPGKSRARETVEKRLSELNKYLTQLLDMEDRIAESDVVYTFLHCLIRDEQEKTRIEEEGMNEGGAVAGKVKVHLMYDRKRESLSVMIRHVRDLVPREGSDSADPYVKMYLKPDVAKTTKQKTKIARRTLHPTYNESFTYKVPNQALPQKTLELSVWDASILLNKQCLAMATLDLCTLQSELTSGCGRWVELHSPTQATPTHLE